MRLSNRLFTLIILIVIILGSGLVIFSRNHVGRSAVPEQLTKAQKDNKFSLYYPASLPPNYIYDPAFFSQNTQVTTYGFKDKTQVSNRIIITVQAKPSLEITDNFSGDKEFTTTQGRVYIIDNPTNVSGGLVGDSLLLFTSPKSISSTQITDLLKSLQPLQQ